MYSDIQSNVTGIIQKYVFINYSIFLGFFFTFWIFFFF